MSFQFHSIDFLSFILDYVETLYLAFASNFLCRCCCCCLFTWLLFHRKHHSVWCLSFFFYMFILVHTHAQFIYRTVKEQMTDHLVDLIRQCYKRTLNHLSRGLQSHTVCVRNLRSESSLLKFTIQNRMIEHICTLN